MNDDYLWDRTGEPDREIQQLEEILGTLRYQPQPLVIPAELRPHQKRSHFSNLAIAAAIAVMLCGAGWWILLTSRHAADSARVRPTPTANVADPAPLASVKPANGNVPAIRSTLDEKSAQLRARRVRQTMVARNVRHPNGAAPLGTPLSRGRPAVVKGYQTIARERSEAEAAKEKLFLALRVASAKLSLAQKRMQVTNPANVIRNQHKVG